MPTGRVHEVRMELASGQYRFVPAQLTIQAGDLVRWINVSGGPHNVHFKRDQVPAGAADVLNAAMKGRLQDLQGPFLLDSLASYDVSFVGAPAGSYAYTCSPHEALGMNARLTVAP
jgi:plastocyanin